MDKNTVNVIMQFMLRVNLNGSEVPAFNGAMNALQHELNRNEQESTEVKDGSDK